MLSTVKFVTFLVFLLSFVQLSTQFSVTNRIRTTNLKSQSTSSLHMKGDIDSDDDGYGPVGSLLRQGPVPFFIRIVNPTTYEQAVQKYMALEKCSRLVAQANMDAYFQDPNGWAGNKLRARRTGKDIDYTRANIDPKSLGLTAVWATGISYLLYRIVAVQVFHQLP